jgi:hypothetical protein
MATLVVFSSTAQAQTYPVTIDSDPPGATIYFDVGDEGIVETTPYSGRLPAGTYSVVFELAGHRDKIVEFTVGKKKRGEKLSTVLERYEPAYLRLEILPSDLEGVVVRIDEEAQEDPRERFELSPGTHRVEAVHKELGTRSGLVEVEAGKKYRLPLDFTKEQPSSGGADDDTALDDEVVKELGGEDDDESAGPRAIPWVNAGAGLELGGRRFTFSNPINLRNYQSFGQALVRGYIEVSPLATSENAWLRQLAVIGSFGYAIPFQSTSPGSGGLNADTTWFDYDLAVRAGYEFGEDRVVDLQLGIGGERFSFDDGMPGVGIDTEVAGVDYRFARLGAGVRMPVYGGVHGIARASYHLVFQTGDIDTQLGGGTTTHGVSGLLGTSVKFFGDKLDVRVLGRMSMYMISFGGPGSPTGQNATGGNDMLFGLMATAGYVF